MDVAFKMRGRREVLVIDACHTGETPGTIYEVPGSEVETMAEPSNLHSHNFRWDHALAMARWLLKDAYPPAVRVFLIEAAQTGFGEPLSPPVQKALQSLKHRLAAEFAPRFAPVAC